MSVSARPPAASPKTPSPSRERDSAARDGHVLVGIDGSPESLAALCWAQRFALATGRSVHIAHAWQRGGSAGDLVRPAGSDDAAVEQDVERRLCQIAEASDVPNVVTHCRALSGEAASALIKEASRSGADLVVVGARGSGGALRVLLGTVSRSLIQCPSSAIAIVPLDHADVGERGWTIAVGVDGSAGSSRALRWAGETARRSGGDVVVIHAFDPPVPGLSRSEHTAVLAEARTRADREWCAPLRDSGVDHRLEVMSGDARDVISRVVTAMKPACVVVGSRGLGAFSQRLLGSVTRHLVCHLDSPTVIVPSPRECPTWVPDGAAVPT